MWKQAMIIKAEMEFAFAQLRLMFSSSAELFGDGAGIGEKRKQRAKQCFERRIEYRRVCLEKGDAVHAFVIVSGDPFEKAACVRRDPFAGDGIGSAMDLGTMGASQFDIRLSSIKIIEIPDP